MDLQLLLTYVLSLAGVAGLISVVIDVLKRFGLVKDGDAPTWTSGAQLLVLIAVWALKVFNPAFDVEGMDAQLAGFLAVFVPFLNFILDNFIGKLTHKALRGAYLIGTSHTLINMSTSAAHPN